MTRSVIAVLTLSAVLAATPALAASNLSLGFADPGFQSPVSSAREALFDDSRSLGARVVRLSLPWSAVASRPPTSASDPADSAYHWEVVDGPVREATTRGFRVLLSIESAPPWSEGSHRPRSAAAGTWRPSPTALEAFATAAGRRYSGAFPDPLDVTARLPRVRYWQVWNEPNLSNYLTPQWTRRGGRFVPASPAWYRAMLNAAYAGLKRARSDNFVVTAGTAPYGDAQAGGRRIAPVNFYRELLCMHGRHLHAGRCHHPAHLDAIAHHPYAVRGPTSHAFSADDAAIPDVYKLARVLRVAQRSGLVLPAGRKHLWVTELSWDSSPPDPQGVPETTHARWLEQSFYLLWKQGVDTITWFQVRDQRPVPSYAATNQSGVLFADGRPKLAARAFRFPFVASPGKSGLTAWGVAPQNGRLSIDHRVGRSWRTLKVVRASAGRVFLVRLGVHRNAKLRARVAGRTSLVWRISK